MSILNMNFADSTWPIHAALAWALTRDRSFTERATLATVAGCSRDVVWMNDNFEKWTESSEQELDRAWTQLHRLLASGQIPLFDDKGQRFPAYFLVDQDWPIRPANLYVSSAGVLHFFQPGSDPIAFYSHQADAIDFSKGYVSLTAAALYLATDGGRKSIVLRDTEAWKSAFEMLLLAICDNAVPVIGISSGRETPEPISGYTFSGLPVSFPYAPIHSDFAFKSNPFLRCGSPTRESNDEITRGILSDAEVLFTKLQVKAQLVVDLHDQSRADVTKSGAPGRPSSMNLVLSEYQRRREAHTVESSARAEAKALETWLKSNHPKHPCLTEKTIRNKLTEGGRFTKDRNGLK